jgi:hypothetical protein
MYTPKDIMPAIDLLMNAKRGRKLPRYVKFLDYALAGIVVIGFWGGFIFLLYKLFQWL